MCVRVCMFVHRSQAASSQDMCVCLSVWPPVYVCVLRLCHGRLTSLVWLVWLFHLLFVCHASVDVFVGVQFPCARVNVCVLRLCTRTMCTHAGTRSVMAMVIRPRARVRAFNYKTRRTARENAKLASVLYSTHTLANTTNKRRAKLCQYAYVDCRARHKCVRWFVLTMRVRKQCAK